MNHEQTYSENIAYFENHALVTVGCGTTCGCLGDERNLREFLVSDETARRLHEAGHAVISLLINDNLEPLNRRQLRVAFNNDETLIEQWASWCGKPIAHVPDPWGCHDSYSAHFEACLRDRLHSLNCSPNLISSNALYNRGLYAPYVYLTLSRYDEILQFLTKRFPGYQPEKLYSPLCPSCGCIDETTIEKIDKIEMKIHCRHCDQSFLMRLDEAKGKLNWKLDCAARWVIFNIDAEPFSKAYLEPQCGSFVVAQEISKKFFGGHDIFPLRYGVVKIDKSASYKLLSSLPAGMLRILFSERVMSDINITNNYILTVASRHQLKYGCSYLDFVKQLVPLWLLQPQKLTDQERDLLACGLNFAEHFQNHKISLQLPSREQLEDINPVIIGPMHNFLVDIIRLREECGTCWESFCDPTKMRVAALGEDKSAIIGHMRTIVGQKQGVPAARLLFLLPIEYLKVLEYMLEMQLRWINNSTQITNLLVA